MTETDGNPSDNFFVAAFHSITSREPFPWQRLGFQKLVQGPTPPIHLNLPTGTGKTSLIPIWMIALAWQASQESRITLPRRLVWVVNRRVVVDQVASLTDQLAIGWHSRLVGDVDAEAIGIWAPRARPRAQSEAV